MKGLCNAATGTCSCWIAYDLLPDCSETDNCVNGVDTADRYEDPFPCKNGGTCSDRPGEDFECACPPGYTGLTCEDEDDPCISDSSCGTNAECIATSPGVGSCRCRTGFQGDPGDGCVQIDECVENNPCLNGAECRDNDVPGEDPICDCLDGTSGSRCEQDDDECAEGNPCDGKGLCMDSRTNFYVPLDEVVCACNLGRGSTNDGDNCGRQVTYREGTASAASYYSYYISALLLIFILCLGACASGKYFKRGMDMSKGSIGAATSMLPTGGEKWVQRALQASVDAALDVVGMDDEDNPSRGSLPQTQRQQQPSYAPQAPERPSASRQGGAPAGSDDQGFRYAPDNSGAYGMAPSLGTSGQPAAVPSARAPSTAAGSASGSANGMTRIQPRRPTGIAMASGQSASLASARPSSVVAGGSMTRLQPKRPTGMASVSSFETETLQRPGRVRPRATTPQRRSAPPPIQSMHPAGRTGRDVV